jgi:hypothetical protein
MVMLPRSRSLTPTYILLLLPREYAKICLFSPKNLSPALGEDPKRLLGFYMNAPRL